MNWIVLSSFVVLLGGVFILKKLWLGVLASVVILIVNASINEGISSVYLPMVSALLLSLELSLLLFGAFLFYTILSSNDHFKEFIKTTSEFPSQLSIIMILCVFMGSFLEGIAGFGIPAMMMAPLLMTLGFKPLTSIILPLAADTTAVTFGALGTPFKVGLDIHSVDSTSILTGGLNILPALALPFILAILYTKTEEKTIAWKTESKALLGAGVCLAVPYFLVSLFSIEYPSLVAGIIGMVTFVFFFTPKTQRPSVQFWLNTFYPYLIFLALLVIAKYFLSDYNWEISSSLDPINFYQPGAIFILTGILYLIITKGGKFIQQFASHSKITLVKIGKSVGTIVLLVCFAQLIQDDISSLAHAQYARVSDLTRIYITPVMGVAGSFILGTATMSNLLLASGVRDSNVAELSVPLLLALLNTGSSVGNAISFQNIIMVKSVVNAPVTETNVLRFNLVTIGIYLSLAVSSALVIRLFI